MQITGASMAETFRGEHFKVRCIDCSFAFNCDLKDPPHDLRAVCPNCGFKKIPLVDETVHGGDRVNVNTRAFLDRPPLRWEVVAFQVPTKKDMLSIKRIVGLPGELISIRHGDLFIDGQVHRKSIEQLRSVAILVHNNDFLPKQSKDLPHRWQPGLSTSHWKREDAGFTADHKMEGTEESTELDWIVYHHLPCLPSLADRAIESPIKDNYAYNQGLSRKLHFVTDILFSCRLSLKTSHQLGLRIHNGREFCTVIIDQDSQSAKLRRGDVQVKQVTLPTDISDAAFNIELAYFDEQLVLAIDRQEVFVYEIQTHTNPLRPTSRPLAIGISRGHAEIRQLRVLRDVHYLDPERIGLIWSADQRLGDNEFFLLGDNVPISIDSRNWANPALSRDRLLGLIGNASD